MGETADKSGVVYYRRLLKIDEMISSGRKPTIEDFRHMEDPRDNPIGRATIFRMIQFLKDQLHAPIVYDRAKTALDKLQKNTVKNPNEWNACHYTSADDSRQKWMADKFIFLQDTRLDIDEKIWSGICSALKANRTMKFDYNGIWNENTTHRTADPYQMLFARGTWYVFCYDRAKKDHRIFALNRIKNLQLDAKFTPMPNYSFKKFSKGIFGAFVGEETKTYKIQFYEDAIPYMSERVWGEDQKIVKQKDGSIILSFKASEEYEIERMVMSFGQNAFPLAPKSLVEEWKDDVAQMSQRLKSSKK